MESRHFLKPLGLIAISFFVLLLLISRITSFSKPMPYLPDPFSSSVLKVYVAHLPRDLNYGLLESYWRERYHRTKTFLGEEEEDINAGLLLNNVKGESMPYPNNPLWKQYSADYWILRDIMSQGGGSTARRVLDPTQADVILVPFFASLSAEMQLAEAKGKFRHHEGNEDYLRQRKVIDIVTNSSAWRRSGGKDHIFILTDPVAMWHVRQEIAPAILLLVDFGGWYMVDGNVKPGEQMAVQHTQVSLLKDVIVPYAHLLPTLDISENQPRQVLLYFKGARHRHRTGLVRDKLWTLLESEPRVVMEEGFPNKTGRDQAIRGMRNSDFCLHPAGDTPTSNRLFDAIASLCIPVIISDQIELPFEGMLNYTKFALFVSVQDALQPKYLINLLQKLSSQKKNIMRQNLAKVQCNFEYENRCSTGQNTAVDLIWRKIAQKVPAIVEAVTREHRKPKGSSIPARCNCV